VRRGVRCWDKNADDGGYNSGLDWPGALARRPLQTEVAMMVWVGLVDFGPIVVVLAAGVLALVASLWWKDEG